MKLSDVISKSRSRKRVKKIAGPVDIKKETVSFMKHIDYSRLCGYDVAELLKFEVTCASFYLFKDGYIRKSQKSELPQEIKKMLPETCPEQKPKCNMESMFVFDFMGYCRKVPIKKLQLRTYEDLYVHLWNTFRNVAKESSRLDIVFDLYLEQSIKQQECTRRGTTQPVEVSISMFYQQLPVDIDSFWASSSNKMQLQGNNYL